MLVTTYVHISLLLLNGIKNQFMQSSREEASGKKALTNISRPTLTHSVMACVGSYLTGFCWQSTHPSGQQQYNQVWWTLHQHMTWFTITVIYFSSSVAKEHFYCCFFLEISVNITWWNDSKRKIQNWVYCSSWANAFVSLTALHSFQSLWHIMHMCQYSSIYQWTEITCW